MRMKYYNGLQNDYKTVTIRKTPLTFSESYDIIKTVQGGDTNDRNLESTTPKRFKSS